MHFSKSSAVWSHGARPSNEPEPSFVKSTSYCRWYIARPWRTVQLGFCSEFQVHQHQSLGSSLQNSGIFSQVMFLSQLSQYLHMALSCLLLLSNLITMFSLVVHSKCISCWWYTWTKFTLVATMYNMMNLYVCKHIVSVLRLVGALQATPDTLAFFRDHLRALRVQHWFQVCWEKMRVRIYSIRLCFFFICSLYVSLLFFLTVFTNKLESTGFLFNMLRHMIYLLPCIFTLCTLPDSQPRPISCLKHLPGHQR